MTYPALFLCRACRAVFCFERNPDNDVCPCCGERKSHGGQGGFIEVDGEMRRAMEFGVPRKLYHQSSAERSGTVENEVAEFLAALVRLIKPQAIIECGAYRGETSAMLAEACADYGGTVFAIEIDPTFASQISTRENLHIVNKDALAWIPPNMVDMVFIDAGDHANRLALLKMYLPLAKWIILHDMIPNYGLATEANKLIAASLRETVYFPSACGLTVVGPETKTPPT